MVVRGAPAIGIAAGYGVALAAGSQDAGHSTGAYIKEAANILVAARPTAVNLAWAVDRVCKKAKAAIEKGLAQHEVYLAALSEARLIEQEDLEMNKAIGRHGATLIGHGSRILTHCNAGALATGGYGTALGVVRRAWDDGKVDMVYACETRPWLQGARLTAWELLEDGIDVTLLVDSAAGYLMSRGMIDCVIVGADRIARNGDAANKIGTYSLARLADAHNIPFYVAAPSSTIDMAISDMTEIPVEERPAEEISFFRGIPLAPAGARIYNPSFDLTPASLVGAIITERGTILPPIGPNLVAAFS